MLGAPPPAFGWLATRRQSQWKLAMRAGACKHRDGNGMAPRLSRASESRAWRSALSGSEDCSTSDRRAGAQQSRWFCRSSAANMHRLRILIVDDHEIVRRGIRALLEANSELDITGEAGSGREAIRQAREL